MRDPHFKQLSAYMQLYNFVNLLVSFNGQCKTQTVDCRLQTAASVVLTEGKMKTADQV